MLSTLWTQNLDFEIRTYGRITKKIFTFSTIIRYTVNWKMITTTHDFQSNSFLRLENIIKNKKKKKKRFSIENGSHRRISGTGLPSVPKSGPGYSNKKYIRLKFKNTKFRIRYKKPFCSGQLYFVRIYIRVTKTKKENSQHIMKKAIFFFHFRQHYPIIFR